tara:strand:+ start:4356 stop:4538 length:183 start_codon:yes stop_codon:yes gene_type:complete
MVTTDTNFILSAKSQSRWRGYSAKHHLPLDQDPVIGFLVGFAAGGTIFSLIGFGLYLLLG